MAIWQPIQLASALAGVAAMAVSQPLAVNINVNEEKQYLSVYLLLSIINGENNESYNKLSAGEKLARKWHHGIIMSAIASQWQWLICIGCQWRVNGVSMSMCTMSQLWPIFQLKCLAYWPMLNV
jgi:hypothetical protein